MLRGNRVDVKVEYYYEFNFIVKVEKYFGYVVVEVCVLRGRSLEIWNRSSRRFLY